MDIDDLYIDAIKNNRLDDFHRTTEYQNSTYHKDGGMFSDKLVKFLKEYDDGDGTCLYLLACDCRKIPHPISSDYLRKSVEKGNPKAIYCYVVHTYNDLTPKEKKTLLLQSANKGHVNALYKLAECYERGYEKYGIKRNISKSLYWWEKSYEMEIDTFCGLQKLVEIYTHFDTRYNGHFSSVTKMPNYEKALGYLEEYFIKHNQHFDDVKYIMIHIKLNTRIDLVKEILLNNSWVWSAIIGYALRGILDMDRYSVVINILKNNHFNKNKEILMSKYVNIYGLKIKFPWAFQFPFKITNMVNIVIFLKN